MYNHVNEFLEPCSGCGACVNVCQKNAVKVKLNNEGLYVAFIDELLCINCGLCKTVCVRGNKRSCTLLTDGKLVAAQSSNASYVKECTSGGIAYELSRYAFNNGIGVFGVVYNYKNNRAESIVAKTKEDINRFRGSKYIQSYTVDAINELLADMKKNPGREFLVFGTPCQIYGIASLLEKEDMRERAILVDLFCHGVPSYFVWDKYLESLKNHLNTENLTEVNFRDKSIGWHNFVIKLKSEKGIYTESSEGDLFYRAFFDNVLFSKACFNCSVRKVVTKADIRLGDYWGKKYQDREDGVSAILLFTERGEGFLEKIKAQITCFEAGSIDELLAAQSVHMYTTEKYRENAFSDLIKGRSLKNTVVSYRKMFPIKKRTKLFVKECTSKLPNNFRAMLRRIYKKL